MEPLPNVIGDYLEVRIMIGDDDQEDIGKVDNKNTASNFLKSKICLPLIMIKLMSTIIAIEVLVNKVAGIPHLPASN